MPLVFALIGLMFVVVAVRGTQKEAVSLLRSEFSGRGNFIVWAMALLILGSLGYIRQVRPVARALIGLVVLSMILANRGFFAAFNEQISATNTPAKSTPEPLPALPTYQGTPEQKSTAIPLPSQSGSWLTRGLQIPGQSYTLPDGGTCKAGSYLSQLFGIGQC